MDSLSVLEAAVRTLRRRLLALADQARLHPTVNKGFRTGQQFLRNKSAEFRHREKVWFCDDLFSGDFQPITPVHYTALKDELKPLLEDEDNLIEECDKAARAYWDAAGNENLVVLESRKRASDSLETILPDGIEVKHLGDCEVLGQILEKLFALQHLEGGDDESGMWTIRRIYVIFRDELEKPHKKRTPFLEENDPQKLLKSFGLLARMGVTIANDLGDAVEVKRQLRVLELAAKATNEPYLQVSWLSSSGADGKLHALHMNEAVKQAPSLAGFQYIDGSLYDGVTAMAADNGMKLADKFSDGRTVDDLFLAGIANDQNVGTIFELPHRLNYALSLAREKHFARAFEEITTARAIAEEGVFPILDLQYEYTLAESYSALFEASSSVSDDFARRYHRSRALAVSQRFKQSFYDPWLRKTL